MNSVGFWETLQNQVWLFLFLLNEMSLKIHIVLDYFCIIYNAIKHVYLVVEIKFWSS